MTVQDEVVQEVISKNKAKKKEREKVQNEMDDAMEALTIIDSAISSGYLLDKHSLILQNGLKNINKILIDVKCLYRSQIMSKENMLRAALATKQLEIDKLKLKIKELENGSNRQRDTSDRKKNTRSKQNNSSD